MEIVLNTTTVILEVSLVGEDQQFKLNGLQWEDPAAWGLLLADMARFIAETYENELGIEKNSACQQILQGLHVDLNGE